MRDAVLFDLDGTLVDSGADITDAFAHAVGVLRPAHVLEHGDIARHVGLPLAEMARRLGLALEVPDEPAFDAAYRARFDALASARTRPFEGIVPLLEQLALPPASRLAVVTAKITYQAQAVLEATSLRTHFAHVQGWAPGLAHKPAPDLMLRALDALGVGASEAISVGETPTDVRAGRAAGTRTIAVTWGFGRESDLATERLDAMARSVDELSRLLAG